MSFIELAAETARYHNRMAVRAIRWFHDPVSANAHRVKRDRWMSEARQFKGVTA